MDINEIIDGIKDEPSLSDVERKTLLSLATDLDIPKAMVNAGKAAIGLASRAEDNSNDRDLQLRVAQEACKMVEGGAIACALSVVSAALAMDEAEHDIQLDGVRQACMALVHIGRHLTVDNVDDLDKLVQELVEKHPALRRYYGGPAH